MYLAFTLAVGVLLAVAVASYQSVTSLVAIGQPLLGGAGGREGGRRIPTRPVGLEARLEMVRSVSLDRLVPNEHPEIRRG
ncbi:MAG: hypothetical protein ACREKQ_08310 [Candidatus Rokuibacteriota bacterium]